MATIKEMLTANTADINTATELLKVLGDREGQYVWKQLTAEGGDFVAFVTADDEGSYPNKGTQDGYYYVKFDPLTAIAENIREGVSIFDIIGTMSEGVSGIAFGEVTPSSDVSTIAVNHNLASVPKYACIISSKISQLQGTSTTMKTYIMCQDTERILDGNAITHYGPTIGANSITFGSSIPIMYFKASHKYYWFAVK